jgi:hypothetical protein
MKSKKAKNLKWASERKKQRTAEKNEMRQFVTLARARQEAMSGRNDLPRDPLGVALGSDLISQHEYEVGRLFERLQTKIFGKPHAKAASAEPKKTTSQTTVETESDREDKALLDCMVADLKSIRRWTIVRDMCFYHRWRRRNWAHLREGLQAISSSR